MTKNKMCHTDRQQNMTAQYLFQYGKKLEICQCRMWSPFLIRMNEVPTIRQKYRKIRVTPTKPCGEECMALEMSSDNMTGNSLNLSWQYNRS